MPAAAGLDDHTPSAVPDGDVLRRGGGGSGGRRAFATPAANLRRCSGGGTTDGVGAEEVAEVAAEALATVAAIAALTRTKGTGFNLGRRLAGMSAAI